MAVCPPLERGTVGGDPGLGVAAEEERWVPGGQLSSAPPGLPCAPTRQRLSPDNGEGQQRNIERISPTCSLPPQSSCKLPPPVSSSPRPGRHGRRGGAGPTCPSLWPSHPRTVASFRNCSQVLWLLHGRESSLSVLFVGSINSQ